MAKHFTDAVFEGAWEDGECRVYALSGTSEYTLLVKDTTHPMQPQDFEPRGYGTAQEISDLIANDYHVAVSAAFNAKMGLNRKPVERPQHWYLMQSSTMGGEVIYRFVRCTEAKAESEEESGTSIMKIAPHAASELNQLLAVHGGI